MSRAVVTLSIGEKFAELGRLTHPLMKDYAARHHADFIVFQHNQLIPGKPHYEKFRIAPLLDAYESILYLDTDIIINPRSPDLFDVVPSDAFGAYLVSEHSTLHDTSILEIQQALGDLAWSRTYFNSGVMIARRQHRGVFDLAHGTHEGFFEQTQINYNVHKLGVPLVDITYKFNHTTAVKKPEERLQSYFIHYPGPGHVPGKPRIDQIRDDIRALTQASWIDKLRGNASPR